MNSTKYHSDHKLGEVTFACQYVVLHATPNYFRAAIIVQS